MKLQSVGNQARLDHLYDASSTVTTGGTAQLVLAQSISRCKLILGNNSLGPLWFEFGAPRATATVSGGAVTAVALSSGGGFGYTKPPKVTFLGGGYPIVSPGQINSTYVGLAQPNAPTPSHPAQAHCVLTGGAVSSIVIDDPGALYVTAPFVLLENDPNDPIGCIAAAQNLGVLIPSGGQPLVFNGSSCTTDTISVYGASTGQGYMCKWMD